MGDWLRGNVDWALSRERYWGTPLPVWRCTSNSRAHARHRVARRARGALGRAPGGPASALRGRGRLPVPALRRAHGARARGHRRVVRLGLDALRAVPRAVREPGALRGAQLRELRVRGARPDARVVLLAAGHQRAALRSLALRDGRLPRPHPRRRGAEDVEVEGQHRRALGGHRSLRRRCRALVLLHRQEPVGRLPLQPRDDRRVDPALPAPAVEHLRLPLDLRARARGRGDRPRPLDPVAPERHGRDGHRAPGRVRHDDGRPGHRRVRRRPLQLVRARVAAALLGGRRRRLRHARDGAAHRLQAGRPVHALHRRRALRQPRRHGALGPSHRLARARRAATSASSTR